MNSVKTMDNKISHRKKETFETRVHLENSMTVEKNLSCPKYLDNVAKKEWQRMIYLFEQMESDLLCDLDLSALAMYCQATSIYQSLLNEYKKLNKLNLDDIDFEELKKCIKIKTLKLVKETNDDPTTQFLWLVWNNINDRKKELQKQMNEQIKVVTELSKQLCLTPIGRAKMGLVKQVEAEDPLDELGF